MRALQVSEARPEEAIAMQKQDAHDREHSRTVLRINDEAPVVRGAVADAMSYCLARADVDVDQVSGRVNQSLHRAHARLAAQAQARASTQT